MDAFVERGGNFLDTADFSSRWLPGHQGGEAEEIIGRWMQRRGNRQEMIIATKVYQPMGEHPNDRGLSRKHLIEALDLYLAHAFDAETPVEETLQALDDARRVGKIRMEGREGTTKPSRKPDRRTWESQHASGDREGGSHCWQLRSRERTRHGT